MSHTGENEQGLRKILDFTRFASIFILLLHFYYWILRTIVYHLFQRIVYQCFSPKFTSKFCFGIFISVHSLPLVAT
jgi:hypothetical protein